MTAEELEYCLQNKSDEKLRLYQLLKDPEAAGLDAETVAIIEQQMDLLCSLDCLTWALPYEQAELIGLRYPHPCYTCLRKRLAAAGRLPAFHEARMSKRQQQVQEADAEAALSALLAAVNAQVYTGEYYRRWRQRFEEELANYNAWLDRQEAQGKQRYLNRGHCPYQSS